MLEIAFRVHRGKVRNAIPSGRHETFHRVHRVLCFLGATYTLHRVRFESGRNRVLCILEGSVLIATYRVPRMQDDLVNVSSLVSPVARLWDNLAVRSPL